VEAEGLDVIPSTQRLMTKSFYHMFPEGRCWLSLIRRGPRYASAPAPWWQFWRTERKVHLGTGEDEVRPRQEVQMTLNGNRIEFDYQATSYDDLEPGRYFMGMCPSPTAAALDEVHLIDLTFHGSLVVDRVTFEMK
jgi:hypothetical protein